MKSVLKSIYGLLPFKGPLYKMLRKAWAPPESIYRHLHFKGVFTVPVDSSHSFRMMHYGYQIENEVFWAGLDGGWEKVSFGLWIKLCRNSKVIVDVGANTGVFALIARALNRQASVYAFEPVKRVFEKLESNNRLNGLQVLQRYSPISLLLFDRDLCKKSHFQCLQIQVCNLPK